jgi:hypothetical protein
MNTGDSPTVGDSVLAYVSRSGSAKAQRGKMMDTRPMGRGSSPTGTTSHRSSHKIQEANGPKCCIQTTLYKANAAEASMQQRNVRLMPSATGTGDFWKERSQFGKVY